MQDTRTSNASKNIIASITSKIILLGLSFVSRTCFIYTLGKTLLGVNGLYTQILSVLSFAELGFGTALTFSFYKPIADNNKEKIVQLISFYRKVYFIIGIIIFTLGSILAPFIPLVIKGAESISNSDLIIFFFLFLINTVSTYFISYKRTFLTAAQKSRVCTIFETVTSICTIALQIVILLIFKNFYVYLISQTAIIILSRAIESLYLNKKFEIFKLKPKQKLPKDEKDRIFNEVKNLSIHKLSGIAVYSTDNIIISVLPFLGVAIVGIVSNYNLIIDSVIAFVVLIFSNVSCTFGNIAASNDQIHFRKTFYRVNFLSYWLYGFCCIAFLILIPPFIKLWIHEEYLIDNISLLIIVANTFLKGVCTTYIYARDSKGNFGIDKIYALLEAVINLVSSLIFAYFFGLVGIFLGTFISKLFLFFTRPISTHKFLYDESPTVYLRNELKHFLVLLFILGVSVICCFPIFIFETSLRSFIATCLIVALVPNILFLITFKNSDQYHWIMMTIKSLINTVLKRKTNNK